MKKIFTLLLVLCGVFSLCAKELKVLMIGNSFSNSLFAYLPKMVEASKKHKLKLGNAYIGGCTIERHCQNIDAEKTKPDFKPYSFAVTGEKSRKEKLSVMLKAEKWDIVTIQQGSRHSPYKDKTQELSKKLIAFVRQYAPQAEIIVHQTWAYRADHNWFTGKNPQLTRQKMHDMLTANYTELAQNNKFRMIPVGNAVQLFREKLPVKEVKYTSADLQKLVRPQTMDVTGGDVVGSMHWRKDRKDPKKIVLGNDRIHLNYKGQYLQACVWYMVLFDETASGIKLDYKHKDAKLIRECAEAAVKAVRK
jgi:hypothetical protein